MYNVYIYIYICIYTYIHIRTYIHTSLFAHRATCTDAEKVGSWKPNGYACMRASCNEKPKGKTRSQTGQSRLWTERSVCSQGVTFPQMPGTQMSERQRHGWMSPPALTNPRRRQGGQPSHRNKRKDNAVNEMTKRPTSQEPTNKCPGKLAHSEDHVELVAEVAVAQLPAEPAYHPMF